MVSVISSVIKNVDYDGLTRILEISFYTGRTYHYHNVPKNIYKSLVSAYSVGSFYNEHIKGVYASEYVGMRIEEWKKGYEYEEEEDEPDEGTKILKEMLEEWEEEEY